MRLRRPLPLDASAFDEPSRSLTLREFGALVLLAMAWWPKGVLPRGETLNAALGVRGERRNSVMPVVEPYFAPGGSLAILRAAHIAKASRRAKAARASTRSRMAKGSSRGKSHGKNVE